MMDPRPSPSISAIKVEVTPVNPLSSPILTKTTTTLINNHPTTIITQSFTDRIFITVTQLNKFGVLYQASTSSNPASSLDEVEKQSAELPPPLPTTVVSKLVGTEPSPAYTALFELYVAQIASVVKHAARGEERPLIVSLALKTLERTGEGVEEEDEDGELLLTSEEERARFMAVMEAVQRCRVW